jgi:hypothetical protein
MSWLVFGVPISKSPLVGSEEDYLLLSLGAVLVFLAILVLWVVLVQFFAPTLFELLELCK